MRKITTIAAATLAVLNCFADDDLAAVQAAMLADKEATAARVGIRAKASSTRLLSVQSDNSSVTYTATGDLDNVVGSGNLNFRFVVDKPFTQITSAKLEINAYDVDHPSANEHDKVYFNGSFIGRLKGVNGAYEVNTFNISPNLIKCPTTDGATAANTFSVAVNVDNGGWVTGVGWAKLTISGETFKLTASKNDSRGIMLKWTDLGGRYEVWRLREKTRDTWDKVDTDILACEYLDSNVQYGLEYHYRVRDITKSDMVSNTAIGILSIKPTEPKITEVDVSELWLSGKGPYYCFLKWNDFDKDHYSVSSISFDLIRSESNTHVLWPIPTIQPSADQLEVFDVSQNGLHLVPYGRHGQHKLKVKWVVIDKQTNTVLNDGAVREVLCDDVKVFFDKYGYEDHSPIPGWAYYWSADGAIKPIASGGTRGNGRFSFDPSFDENLFGQHTPHPGLTLVAKTPAGYPRICRLSGQCGHTYKLGMNAASHGDIINKKRYPNYRGREVGNDEVGLRALAAVIAHERMHGALADDLFGDWHKRNWLLILGDSNSLQFNSAIELKNMMDAEGTLWRWKNSDYYNAIVEAIDQNTYVSDSDGDGIIDVDETGGEYGSWGFLRTNPDTYNFATYASSYASYGDNEILARKAEGNANEYLWQNAENKDWAWPGYNIANTVFNLGRKISISMGEVDSLTRGNMMFLKKSDWDRVSYLATSSAQKMSRRTKKDMSDKIAAIGGRQARSLMASSISKNTTVNAEYNLDVLSHGAMSSLPEIFISTGSVYVVSCTDGCVKYNPVGMPMSVGWMLAVTNTTEEVQSVKLTCYLADSEKNALAWVATNHECAIGMSTFEISFDLRDVVLVNPTKLMLYAVTIEKSVGDLSNIVSEQIPCELANEILSPSALANDKGHILPNSVVVDVTGEGVVVSGKVLRISGDAAQMYVSLTDSSGLTVTSSMIEAPGVGTNGFSFFLPGDELYRMARPLPYIVDSVRLVENGETVHEIESAGMVNVESVQWFRPADLPIHAVAGSGAWAPPMRDVDGLCSQITYLFTVSNAEETVKSCHVNATLLGTNEEYVCSLNLPAVLDSGTNVISMSFSSVAMKAHYYDGGIYRIGNIFVESDDGNEIEVLHTDGNSITINKSDLGGVPFSVSGDVVCRTGNVYKPIIVEVPIDVMRAGDITASAIVTDTNGEFVVRSETNMTVAVGSEQTVAIEFNARDLMSSGIPGPYKVHYLVLRSGYEGVEEVRIEDFVETVEYTPTLYVNAQTGNDDGDGLSDGTALRTIQAALSFASDGAVIKVGPGDYICPAEVEGETFLNVSKKVSIVASSGTPSETRIVGPRGVTASEVRGVWLTEGAILSGFTITNFLMSAGGGVGVYGEGLGAIVSNCVVAACSATHDGGGIYQCTVYDSDIHNCRAQNGGGAAHSVLFNCNVENNTATSYGGGIAYCDITNCIVQKNTSSMYGGGIAYGDVSQSRITGNRSNRYGGGVYNANLEDCQLRDNTAAQYGGGAFMSTLRRCLVIGNKSTGSYGGGIMDSDAYDCVIQGNEAATYGGGAGYSRIYNCTIIGNHSVRNGGGVYECTAANSIIWDNTTALANNNYCNHCETYGAYNCTLPLMAGEGNIDSDPLLRGAEFGGFMLSAESPCLEAGLDNNEEAEYYSNGLTNYVAGVVGASDFLGNERVQGAHVDIGAVEGVTNACLVMTRTIGHGSLDVSMELLEPHSTIKITADESIRPLDHFELSDGRIIMGSELLLSDITTDIFVTAHFRFYEFYVDAENGDDANDGFSWAIAKKTIQAAIDLARDGEKIHVVKGTYTPIISPDKGVEILAVDGADNTFIDGGGTNRCAYLATTGTIASQTNTVLVGFTLMNGYATQGAGSYGGTLKNCIIKSNTAEGSTYCYGGGTYYGAQYNCRYEGNSVSATMYGYGGAAYYGTSYSCSYEDNSAYGTTNGYGGAACYGIHYDCGVSNNTAKTYGGGIYGGTWYRTSIVNNEAIYGGGCASAAFYDGEVLNNTASSHGGGVYNGNIYRSEVSKNTSAGDGGGAYAANLTDCIIDNNLSSGSGGGALLTNYTATRCAFLRNRARSNGGGVYGGTCNYCGITNNTATSNGGGAYNITASQTSIVSNRAASGGGIYNGTYNFCDLTQNTSTGEGGGAYYGTFYDSQIIGNEAVSSGGGLCRSTFHRTRIMQNTSQSEGGGVYNGTGYNSLIVKNKGLGNGGGTCSGYNYNCTITENWCGGNGGGTSSGYHYNTIIVDNTNPDGEYNRDGGSVYNCLSSNAGDPMFVNPGEGDYRLRIGSSCIDAGNNSYANGSTDLALATRIQGGTIDMGAYEGGVEGYVVAVDSVGVGRLEYDSPVVTNGGSFMVLAAPTDRTFLHFKTNGVVATTAPVLTLDGIAGDIKITAEFVHEMFVDGETGENDNDGLSWATAKKTIQAAIDDALDGDVIWVADGLYDPIYSTKHISIMSVNGADSTIIDGQNRGGCAVLDSTYLKDNSTGTRLSGFTLRNGYKLHGAGVQYGMIDNCIVENCQATGHGGGVDYAMVSNCVIRNNMAQDYGGGIASAVRHRIVNCQIVGNYAVGNGGAQSGGGIFRRCEFVNNIAGGNGGAMYDGVAHDSVFHGNRAATGGATYNGTFYRCSLVGNSSTGDGGGAYYGTFYDSVVSNNTASGVGGGLSRSTYWRSRVINNTSNGDGGGVYNGTGYNSIIANNKTIGNGSGGGTSSGYTYNCTIYGNYTSYNGGGTYNGYHYNSIIWGNEYHNGSSNTSGGSYYFCITVNPLFVSAVDGDYRIRAGSPCINSGNSSYVNGSADVTGQARVQDGIVDVGAHEGAVHGNVVAVSVVGNGKLDNGTEVVPSGGVFSVSAYVLNRDFLYFTTNGVVATTSNTLRMADIAGDIEVSAVFAHEMFVDANNGNDARSGLSWGEAKRTIQSAIDVSVEGDTIWVADGVYAPFSTNNKRIDIVGVNGAEHTIIDGGNSTRCATLGSDSTHDNSHLRGFTLRNGFSSGYGGGALYGRLSDCSVENCLAMANGGGVCETSLSNCVIRSNSARGSGGGAAISYRSRKVIDCVLSGNMAQNYGGGIYGGTLIRCKLQSNIANNSGGGMYGCFAHDSVVMGNRAPTGGGAYDCTGYYCTLSNNTSTGDGGGAYSGTFYDSIVSDNTSSGAGGGLSRSTYWRCRIIGNISSGEGGGVYNGTGYNSIIAKNKTNSSGGGTSSGTTYNCTITDNFNASSNGGGTYNGYHYNSIVWGNKNVYGHYNTQGGSFYACLTTDPDFVNVSEGDYRLRKSSVGINAGNASYVQGSLDADRNARIQDGVIDIGAFEGGVDGFVVTLVSHAAANIAHSSSTVKSNGVYAITAASSDRPLIGIYTNGVFASNAIPFEWKNVVADGIVSIEYVHDLYVDDQAGDDGNSGLSKTDAKKSVQAAIDISMQGDTIHVADGRYNPFTTENKSIRIVSDNGPLNCIIDGGYSARCVTMGNSKIELNSVIEGLTLCNGYSTAGAGCYYGIAERCIIEDCFSTGNGGGSYGTVLKGCTVRHNVANSQGGGSYGNRVIASGCSFEANISYGDGGGVYNGEFYDCSFVGNRAYSGGGAAYDAVLQRCIIKKNQASSGGGTRSGTMYSCLYYDNYASSSAGGAYYGTLRNCTLTRNKSANSPAGAYNLTAYNTIVWGNYLNSGSRSEYSSGSYYNCCLNTTSTGTNTLATDPLFYDAEHDDFRLSMYSPCVDYGNASYVSESTDIVGNTRIQGPAVDLGCYEGPVNVWEINVVACGHGTVVDNGLSVVDGGSLSFTAVEDGYPFLGFYTNGVFATSEKGFTWKNVSSHGILEAWFKQDIYVDASKPDDSGDGLTWATARKDLSAVVAEASNGANIWVKSGTYTPIATDNKKITITAVDGNSTTVIDGGGTDCCVYAYMNNVSINVMTNTIVVGFTLKNGNALQGGGAYGGTLRECVIESCVAERYGGGTYYGVQYDCVYSNNSVVGTSVARGGATYYGTSYRCKYEGNSVVGDSASMGGGIFGGRHYDCTIQGNIAGTCGGGVANATCCRCILTGNSAPIGGASYSGTLRECLLSGNVAENNGGASRLTTLYGCTVVNNVAEQGGGLYDCVAYNSIVWGNRTNASETNDCSNSSLFYSCFFGNENGYASNLSSASIIANGSFETYVSPLNDSTWGYGCATSHWTMPQNFGIAYSGSPWTSATLPSGSVGCFMQQAGVLSQKVEVPMKGIYRLTFYHASRGSSFYGLQIAVQIDAQELGVVIPKDTTFVAQSYDVYLETGEHIVKFASSKTSVSGAASDQCAIIDAVSLVCLGGENIHADPKFEDAKNGNYRLSSDSPCVDAGCDSYVADGCDIIGNMRKSGVAVDIGCYESSFSLATETQTTPEPVPYSWLKNYSDVLAAFGGDYETMANAQSPGKDGSGKVWPNGSPCYIWQDYVAGTDPIKDDVFTAKIEIVDGKPVVTWEPDTPELRATRVYRTLGKKTLMDANWNDVTDKDKSEYNFFMVTVDLPK